MHPALRHAALALSLALPVLGQTPDQAMWFATGFKNSNFYYDPGATDRHYFNPKAFLSFTHRSGVPAAARWSFYYGTGFCLEANRQHQFDQDKLGNVEAMQTFIEQSDYMKAHLLLGYWMPWRVGGARKMFWGPRITATSSNTRERLVVPGTGQFVGGTTQSLQTQTRYAVVFSDCPQKTLSGAFSELEIGLAHDPFFGPDHESHRIFLKGDLQVPLGQSQTSAALFSATVNKSRKTGSADEVLVEVGYLLRLN